MKVVARHKFAPLVCLDDGSVIDTEDLEVIGNGAVQGDSWEFEPEMEMDPRWEEIARADASSLGVTERKIGRGSRGFRAPSEVRESLKAVPVDTPLTEGKSLTLDEIGALVERDEVTGPPEEWMFNVLNKHEENPDSAEEHELFSLAEPELDYDQIDAAIDDDESLTAAVEAPPGEFTKIVYLAIIEEDDEKSVQDMVALVSTKAGAAAAYTYDDKGWKEDPETLAKLQAAAPPPIKQLEDWQAESIIAQISATNNFDESARPESTEAGPDSPAEAGTEPAQPAQPIQASAFELQESNILWGPDNKRILAIVAEAGTGWGPNAERLRQYWSVGGKGGAKIRWNTPGDWTRCRRHLSKYLGPRAAGYCQNLHKRNTGVYTGSRFNVGGNGRS